MASGGHCLVLQKNETHYLAVVRRPGTLNRRGAWFSIKSIFSMLLCTSHCGHDRHPHESAVYRFSDTTDTNPIFMSCIRGNFGGLVTHVYSWPISREDDLRHNFVFQGRFRSLKRYPRYRSQNNYVRSKQVIFSLR